MASPQLQHVFEKKVSAIYYHFQNIGLAKVKLIPEIFVIPDPSHREPESH
jgi:hypothetical protein